MALKVLSAIAGAASSLVIVFGTVESFAAGAEKADRIRPYQNNPYYWQYKGKPVLLLGGSDDDNLFQWTGENLTDNLDQLVAAGGNYLRNTMSDRDEGNVYAFKRMPSGKFDLRQFHEEYWNRFERFLKETHRRRIFVQIEIWDAFDWVNDRKDRRYDRHPWNPKNNINYTADQSGIPVEWHFSPHGKDHPLVLTIPGQPNADRGKAVLAFQRRFVARILEVSLVYDHVLYTIHNESSAPQAWSDYWAAFIHKQANATGRSAQVSDMREEDRPAKSKTPHQYAIDHPTLYTYLETSKNNRDEVGQAHWDAILDIRRRLGARPRPMNNTKIVMLDGFNSETVERWFRNIFAGSAAERFHRPGVNWRGHRHGLGLGPDARRLIRAARDVTDSFDLYKCTPRNDLLREREANEAYCLAQPGRQYAVYFPKNGEVSLKAPPDAGKFTMRWYDINSTRWCPPDEIATSKPMILKPPADGHWVAVITRSKAFRDGQSIPGE